MQDQIKKCLAELPEGEWDYRVFNGLVIFVCPQHQPRILQDGELTLLKSSYEPNDERLKFWQERRFYTN